MSTYTISNLDATGTLKSITTTDGMMKLRFMESKHNQYVIETIRLRNKTGFELANGNVELRFNTTSGLIRMTRDGFYFTDNKLAKYGPPSFARLVKLIKGDEEFQSSVLSLQSSIHEGVYSLASINNIAPFPELAKQLLGNAKQAMKFSKRPVKMVCRPQNVTQTVSTEVYGWVTSVTSALDQLAECEEDCRRQHLSGPRHNPVDFAICLTACAMQTFQDVFVTTYQVINTFVQEVVTEVVHCTPTLSQFPTPVKGRIVIPANLYAPPSLQIINIPKIIKELGAVGDVITCFVEGQWNSTLLGDVKVSIPGIKEIPIAVSVCFDRNCSNTLKAAFLGKDLGDAALKLMDVVGSGSALSFLLNLGISQGLVDAIAVVLGVTAVEVAGAILGFFIVLMVHSLIIGGQIAVYDLLGNAPNGVCLSYPAYPLGVIGVINPAVALVLAPNIPVVVTPR